MPQESTASRTSALIAPLAVMWGIWVVDLFWPGRIGHGIVPRTPYGVSGIVMAPFLHGNLQHLISNTVPFVILGAVILLRGARAFTFVLLVSALVAGLGTWLFGTPGSEHIGASGVVFGFLGYVLLRAVYDRRLSSFVIAVVIAVLYGAMIVGSLLPAGGISWTGHVFGFAGGVTSARLRYGR
ncbi:MAG TPA: rhomboid family intramembrane serine protease [Thermoanaerobaculia bacterium]|nr:rhomboid family intramembrane serine protease [Thermoanaerobaculia bacterium]